MGVKLVGGKKIDDYIRALENTELQGREIIGHVVFKGAEKVADAVMAEMEALPVGNSSSTVKQYEKDGIIDGFGVSHMRDDKGVMNVKLGVTGYNKHVTKKYPKGQPNAMIARSIISGTSFRQKNDFVGRAVRKARKDALNAMVRECDDLHKKTMNGGNI